VARLKGAVLTPRDRLLISFLGLARYASAAQLHALVAEGRDVSLVYRRLRRLAVRGERPGGGAHVRRLGFRRAEGTPMAVWALTSFGQLVAEQEVPYLRPPAGSDIGSQFVEHTLLLNDVLLGLVVKLRRSASSPLGELPFRWLCENDEVLEFRVLRGPAETRPAVLKPDAILEVPAVRRRLFLEAETGSHSITTADPLRYGPVLRKLERYARFCTAVVSARGPATFYASAFSDGFSPELVFLVHSDGRRAKVEAAIRDWAKGRELEPLGVSVLTFAEAPGRLATLAGATAETSARPRNVTVDEERANRLRSGYLAIAEAFNAAHRAVVDHNRACPQRLKLPPVPIAELKEFQEFILRDLLGNPPQKGLGADVRQVGQNGGLGGVQASRGVAT